METQAPYLPCFAASDPVFSTSASRRQTFTRWCSNSSSSASSSERPERREASNSSCRRNSSQSCDEPNPSKPGAHRLRIRGEEFDVAANIHTIGGQSAHADQRGLLDWYAGFAHNPPVCLVHGEPESMDALAARLTDDHGAKVTRPEYGQTITL